ncbi:MAG TPA: pyridoxamine 5'-phosphate oxidase family protein [Mycobacteriales bacterium]|nr:pyridoxamine 5'-phosphate oxidase family protein [Mycobacteriales bacterium]
MSFTSLTQTECMAKLAQHSIGRIAVTSRALPAIVPVNYAMTGRTTIVFRTEPGGMLARATEDTVVAFEVDELARDGRSGWSVLVVGVAHHLDGSDVVRAVASRVSSAVGEGRDQFVAITIGQITGRVVEPTPSALAGV